MRSGRGLSGCQDVITDSSTSPEQSLSRAVSSSRVMTISRSPGLIRVWGDGFSKGLPSRSRPTTLEVA